MPEAPEFDIVVMLLSKIAKIEADAEQFPEENSAEISFSDMAEYLLDHAPEHKRDMVQRAVAQAIKTAPRHVFIPDWIKEADNAAD
jgi:hypothetical protein